MFFRLLRRSLLGNATQKALSFGTIALACLLLACMLNITLGVGNELTKELRNYGANISVLPQGSSLSIEVGNKTFRPMSAKTYLQLKDLAKIKEIFWRNNITAFAPFLSAEAILPSGKKTTLIGTYFDKNIPLDGEEDYRTGVRGLFSIWGIEGEWVNDDAAGSSDGVLLANVGAKFAAANSLKVGDELAVQIEQHPATIRIAGIIKNAGDYDEKMLVNIDSLGALLGTPGIYERAEVSALTIPENDLAQRARHDRDSLDSVEYDKWYCTAYVGSIAFQIEENYAGASAKAMSKVADAEGAIVQKIQSLMGVIFVICLLVASVAMASLIHSDVFFRQKEIGLLKSLGASNFAIYLIFAADYLVVALVASVVGTFLGFFASDFIALKIFSHGVSYNLIIIAICAFFAALISLLGCLIAARSFIKLEIIEVLYGRK